MLDRDVEKKLRLLMHLWTWLTGLQLRAASPKCESVNNRIVNGARVITTVHYDFVVAMWRAKGAESGMNKPRLN